MCKRKYPLQWLDLLIEALNTAEENNKKNDGISQQRMVADIRAMTEKECTILISNIRRDFFLAKTDKEIKVIVRRYHIMITDYINCLYEIKDQSDTAMKQDNCKVALESLTQVISFLEEEYFSYLGTDRKVPKTVLVKAKKELEVRICDFRSRICEKKFQKDPLTIALNALERFAKSKTHYYKLTYRCILYRKELIRKLESVEVLPISEPTHFCVWDKVLVFMNFNSKTYMDYLIKKFRKKLLEVEAAPAIQLDVILAAYKEFKQLHSRVDIAFNPDYIDLSEFITNWFEQEIGFLRNGQQVPVQPDSNEREKKTAKYKTTQTVSKVLCNLSSDQTALLIRAADDTRILAARSMTEVFRRIVPSISTQNRKDLSYESVRIKSYNPEDKDKEIVIQSLERMIERIREY